MEDVNKISKNDCQNPLKTSIRTNMKYLIYICVIFIVGCKCFKTQQTTVLPPSTVTTVGSLPMVSSTDGVDTSMGCIVEPTPLSDIKSKEPEVAVTKKDIVNNSPAVRTDITPLQQPIAQTTRSTTGGIRSKASVIILIVLGVIGVIGLVWRHWSYVKK